MAISCDPAALVVSAKCFPCVSKAARRWVKTYLLCQIANKGIAKPLSVGLIAYWEMEEATNANRADSIDTNTLTDQGTVTQVAGMIGNAASASGVAGNRLVIAAPATKFQIGAGKSFTMAFWYKPAGGLANTQRLISKETAVAGTSEYSVNIGNTGVLRFQVSNLAGAVIVVQDSPNNPNVAGTWYFITCGYDDANQQIFFQVNNNARLTNACVGVRADANSLSVLCGSTESGFAGIPNATIDELGFWGRVLTSAESVQLYNGGVGMRPF